MWLCNARNDHSTMKRSLWIDTWDHSGFQQTFWTAVDAGDIDMMHFVAEKGVNIANFERVKWTPAHTIAYSISRQNATESQLSTLKNFFTKYSNYLTTLSISGNSPVHLACFVNNSQMLSIIMNIVITNTNIDAKRILNQPKTDKYWEYNPLMIAIENESVDCVELLCNCDKIDIIKHKSKHKNINSLQFACLKNNFKIVKHILSRANKNNDLNHQRVENLLDISKNGWNSFQQQKCVDLLSRVLFFANEPDREMYIDYILTSKNTPSKSIKNDRQYSMQSLNKFPYRCPNGHPATYIYPAATQYACVICSTRSQGYTKCQICGVDGILCTTCATVTSIVKASSSNRREILKPGICQFPEQRYRFINVSVNSTSDCVVELL